MKEICELKRQGLSITQISALTGCDPKTIRKYLDHPATPAYGPRQPRASLLDPFKPYLKDRLAAGVWNGVVLLKELKERGYPGSYTLLREYLQPQRKEAQVVAVRRFETPPGHQAQADWGDLGDLTQTDGHRHKLNAFVLTLGHSRAMFADMAPDQKLPAFLRLHEAAFDYLGGLPQEILYDNTKTVVLRALSEGVDARGEVKLNPEFADFARYWGFTPRLCRPYRPQTKGKVESGIGYLRKNFLCGRDATDFEDLRRQLQRWTAEVANVRVHGTTHRVVEEAWREEKAALQSCQGRRAYPLVVSAVRRVTRDAFVCWAGNRYSFPWQHAGQEVLVQEVGAQIQILRQNQPLAVHLLASGSHQTVTVSAHHQDIPTSAPAKSGKARLSVVERAPDVEVRSLAVYEALASGEAAPSRELSLALTPDTLASGEAAPSSAVLPQAEVAA